MTLIIPQNANTYEISFGCSTAEPGAVIFAFVPPYMNGNGAHGNCLALLNMEIQLLDATAATFAIGGIQPFFGTPEDVVTAYPANSPDPNVQSSGGYATSFVDKDVNPLELEWNDYSYRQDSLTATAGNLLVWRWPETDPFIASSLNMDYRPDGEGFVERVRNLVGLINAGDGASGQIQVSLRFREFMPQGVPPFDDE